MAILTNPITQLITANTVITGVAGKQYIIKNTGASPYTVTLGAVVLTLSAGGSMLAGYDGTNWFTFPDVVTEKADLAGDITDLAGASRTTETVYQNAQDIAALTASVLDVGDFCESARTSKVGWRICIGETIGNAASGATYADDNNEDLFDILNVAGAWGNPGSAVFANGDTVLLPDRRLRVGVGASDTAQTIDGVVHPLAALGVTYNDQTGAHTHGINMQAAANSDVRGSATNYIAGANPDRNQFHTATDAINTVMGAAMITGRSGATTEVARIGVNYFIKYLAG